MFAVDRSETPECQTEFGPTLYTEFPVIALFKKNRNHFLCYYLANTSERSNRNDGQADRLRTVAHHFVKTENTLDVARLGDGQVQGISGSQL